MTSGSRAGIRRSAKADAERAGYRATEPLQVRDETGCPVHVGGRQLRVLLTLLALNAGRVVPARTLAGQF